MATDHDEFLKDLAQQLREAYHIEPPQEADEFTALWFTENVSDKKRNTTRIWLEKEVREGRMMVRRNVRLTWEKRQGKIINSDVYKWVGRVNEPAKAAKKKTGRAQDNPPLPAVRVSRQTKEKQVE